MVLQDIDILIVESFERTKEFVGRNKGKIAIGAIAAGTAYAASKGYLGPENELKANYAKHILNGAESDNAKLLSAADYAKKHVGDSLSDKIGTAARAYKQQNGFGGRFF